MPRVHPTTGSTLHRTVLRSSTTATTTVTAVQGGARARARGPDCGRLVVVLSGPGAWGRNGMEWNRRGGGHGGRESAVRYILHRGSRPSFHRDRASRRGPPPAPAPAPLAIALAAIPAVACRGVPVPGRRRALPGAPSESNISTAAKGAPRPSPRRTEQSGPKATRTNVHSSPPEELKGKERKGKGKRRKGGGKRARKERRRGQREQERKRAKE